MVHTIREGIVEIINRHFILTDSQQWQDLQREVFAADVEFDMTSIGVEK